VYSFADAPVITQGPGNIEAVQSQEYVLTCKAKGVPDPKYEFYKVCGHHGFNQSKLIYIAPYVASESEAHYTSRDIINMINSVLF